MQVPTYNQLTELQPFLGIFFLKVHNFQDKQKQNVKAVST